VALALRRRNRCETAGRIIGATGGVCASAFWGLMLIAALSILIEPGNGIARLAVLVAIPFGAMAAMLFVVSVANVIVLARRADTSMPARVAGAHLMMAVLVVLTSDGAQRLLAVGALLAICATQVVAIRLFQMTPSQASAQR
jgi:hypothetical protein